MITKGYVHEERYEIGNLKIRISAHLHIRTLKYPHI
jgi:hypothetical protein